MILPVAQHQNEVLFGAQSYHATELMVLALALGHYLVQSLQPAHVGVG